MFKTTVVIAAMLTSLPAYADFDKDFASFEKDFARLDAMFAKKKKKQPEQVVVAKAGGAEQALRLMDKDIVEPPKSGGARLREQNEVDPKSSERLGHQLDNPEMREKVAKLYQKPDIKVYSYVLQAE